MKIKSQKNLVAVIKNNASKLSDNHVQAAVVVLRCKLSLLLLAIKEEVESSGRSLQPSHIEYDCNLILERSCECLLEAVPTWEETNWSEHIVRSLVEDGFKGTHDQCLNHKKAQKYARQLQALIDATGRDLNPSEVLHSKIDRIIENQVSLEQFSKENKRLKEEVLAEMPNKSLNTKKGILSVKKRKLHRTISPKRLQDALVKKGMTVAEIAEVISAVEKEHVTRQHLQVRLNILTEGE